MKTSKMVFNNAVQASEDYTNAVKKIKELLAGYSNSEYLSVAESHEAFTGWKVGATIDLKFKPGVYTSTKLKVVTKLDKEVRAILAEHPDALVEYVILVEELNREFFKRYKYLAYAKSQFVLVTMQMQVTGSGVLTEPEALSLLDAMKGGATNEQTSGSDKRKE